MKNRLYLFLCLFFVTWNGLYVVAQVTAPGFKVFQFPSNMIPRIDGDFSDWEMVPDEYTVTIDEMWDDSRKHPAVDKSTLDITVKVGWVKGLNRLYFCYEAYDDYWDFNQLGLRNDTYEVVVDADLSGGPHIERFRHNAEAVEKWESYFTFQNVHAQNYHIFTPPTEGKDWTMVWGNQQWLKELPYANYAYDYNFSHGESGKLRMEFYITPFDFASPEGPAKSVESQLYEGKNIGLCWAVIDYDNPDSKGNNGFWNLSKHHTMYGQASEQRLFTLMPLESIYRKPIEAQWTFSVEDMASRLVSFRDKSIGEITSWKWDFGDGETSDEQHPHHVYKQAGQYVVTLYVEGPAGKACRCKVWDVAVK
ncbi:MAG: PKD domain-containing protein [Mediterranea massiliensis]|nr:PKD domain-containing protein [Mediterranea massiliensis]